MAVMSWRHRFSQFSGPGFDPRQVAQANWAAGVSFLIALAFVLIPLLVVLLAGLGIGMLCYILLSAVNAVLNLLQAPMRTSDTSAQGSRRDAEGRRNVRVIR